MQLNAVQNSFNCCRVCYISSTRGLYARAAKLYPLKHKFAARVFMIAMSYGQWALMFGNIDMNIYIYGWQSSRISSREYI
jgi:hypothetical protein